MDNETIKLVARVMCCGPDGCAQRGGASSCVAAFQNCSAYAIITALTAAGWQRVPDDHVWCR